MLFIADSTVIYDPATNTVAESANPPIKYNCFPWVECVIKAERGTTQREILDENGDVIATVMADGRITIKYKEEVLVDWTPSSEVQLVSYGNELLQSGLESQKIVDVIAGYF